MDLEVWLMRHGDAADPDTAARDEDRALTERGRHQVTALGAWLKERAPTPDIILHSPLRRARETAHALAEGLAGGVPVLEDRALAPGMRAGGLLGALERQGHARVVCVGHQPDIGDCLSGWLGGGHASIAPGTLAVVTFSGAATVGNGTLRGFLNPLWFHDR
jgi:phosphohistidine phosphatase